MAKAMHRLTSRLQKSGMKFRVTFILLSLILVLFREKWLLLVGDFLIIEEILHPADVIHVIAGDDYRTEYAIQLYEQGYGKTLFFTGGWCTFHNYYHGLHAREYSLTRGLSSEAVAFDDSTVTSTYMEAEKLKEWIDQSPNPIHSVIVVSDPFHMRRAQWTYKRVLSDSIEVQMAPVPFDVTSYQRVWWKDSASRLMVREEYQKFAYYLLRYQWSRGFVRNWLASLDQN